MSSIWRSFDAIRLILEGVAPSDQINLIKRLNVDLGIIAGEIDVPKMYTDKQVAERYEVHVKTARQWIVTGRLKGCRIGSKWYSRADWIDEFDNINTDPSSF